jgi:hypothetical protein
MARGNLLNTRTSNYLELVANGKTFFVPPFQRDYLWEEDQWEDLWNDILDLIPNEDERHYMGALVVEATSDREFKIIDGQQRLTTLSILALAVIAKLHDLAESGIDAAANRERAGALRNRFIGEKDPASLVETSKLRLNHADDGFYQDYLVQLRAPLNPRGLSRSNGLLWGCFQYFSRAIASLPAVAQDGRALAALLSETVARQLLFILITVEDELNAYTVFETLNARGLELSSTDLLKNYLFSRVHTPSDLEHLERRWRALIGTVRYERFPEFLRYHLLCELRQVRIPQLYKLVRERVRTPAQVFELMSALEGRAELFSALLDPTHEYWIECPGCRPYVEELNLFRVRQMTPLLFAGWEKLHGSFEAILRIVSVVSFRYSVVSGLKPSDLEAVYHEAARAVLDGTAQAPSQVLHRLTSIYVADDAFRQSFARFELDTAGQRKKLAKYILARLESDLSGQHCDPETDPGTIEHILPENPGQEWQDLFPPDRWDQSINRLGNLTLLEAAKNRAIGHSEYAVKGPVYAASSYRLTQRVAELAPYEWTPALLDRRQQEMASRATHVWRLDS